MDCCYTLVLLILLTGSACSSPVTIEEFFGCSKIGCAPDQYCIRATSGRSRCSDKAVCLDDSSCPVDKVCNVRAFPCPLPNCPYIETCEYSCSLVNCPAGESCVITEDGPHCKQDDATKQVCEIYSCDKDLHCLALPDEVCLRERDNCPRKPVCVNPGDVCSNYQCPDEHKCVPEDPKKHCLIEPCIGRPTCVYDGHPCKEVECEQGYVCVENTPKDCGEHCLREYKCVSEDDPCELYECEAGKVCQPSRNHCIDIRLLGDGNEECRALPECVVADDPCDQYSCPDGYHCRADNSHCHQDHLECPARAVCEEHIETCDDKQCNDDTVCEMQEQDHCHSEPCPQVPVCVAKQKQGRLLKDFLLDLKLAKDSKFQKISHKGKLGIFINESSIFNLLSDLKEKIKNKTQKIIDAPTKLPDDVDTLVSLLAKPKPVNLPLLTQKRPLSNPVRPGFTPTHSLSSPFRPQFTPSLALPTPVVHHPPFVPNRPMSESHRPFRVTPSNSIVYYQGFKPNRKIPSAHRPMPDPVPQGSHRRPISLKSPSMSVFTPRYFIRPAGRSGDADDYDTYFNETEGYQNSTEQQANPVLMQEPVNMPDEDFEPYMMITSEAAEGRAGVTDNIQYATNCGFDGVELEILSERSFSGNISYFEGNQLCKNTRLTNHSQMLIHIPYQMRCGNNIEDFNLQHKVQIDWDDGDQEVLQVNCNLESRSKLETGVSIDPHKTKSILDIQAQTQQALLIFDKYGQPVEGNVRLGETVQLFFTVGMTVQHTFDADLMNCWATSDDGSAREQIIKDSCPIHTEKIQGPTKEYKPNRMNTWNTYDIKYIVKTYPINNSLNVKYSCDVRVCMPECTKKLYCGKDQRVRREEPNSESEHKTLMEVESQSINYIE